MARGPFAGHGKALPLFLVAAFCCLWTITGCGGVVVNADAAAVQLSVSNSTIDFGSVALNTTSTKTLTLTSTGTAPVTVNSVTLAGAGFSFSGISFPAKLIAGQTVTIQVAFNPTVAGLSTGTVSISSDSASNSTTKVNLTGTGAPPSTPQLTVSAKSLDFGPVNLNTTSSQTLTLTSSGSAALTVNSITLTGAGFAVSGATFPATLNPGESLALQFSFDPTVIGAAIGTVAISSDSASGSATVNLTGTGMAAQLTLSVNTLDFGSVGLNATANKTLTLTSSGNAALTVNSVTLSGASFVISGGSFPATLNPGQSLALQVSFDPTVSGAATGTITISSNSISGGASTVGLTGTGTAAQLTVSASTLDFGNVDLNTTSTKTLTLTSSGNSAVTVNSVTLTGAAFAISGGTFPATLNPGQSLSLHISFDPTAAGSATGNITISTNLFSGSTSTVNLAGTGMAAQLTVSASTFDFGDVNLDTTSTKTLTLTSSGNATVTVNSVTLTGTAFAISGVAFPASLNPGQSLALLVSFDPITAGDATGTISISSNSSARPISVVGLTGKGVASQLSVSSNTLDFGDVNLNTSSTKTLTLTSSGNTSVTVHSVTLSGAGFAMSGATFPATLNPGQSMVLQVRFDPTVTGTSAGTITISSNATSGNSGKVKLSGNGLAAQLKVSTSTLDFGNVTLNTTSTQALTLTSSGNSAVTVNSVTLAGTAFAISGATFPATLNPGQSIALQVSFDPTVSGAVVGTVTISTNSRSNAINTVALTGTGIAAQLTVSASTIDFGNTNLSSSSTKTLTLTSSGNAAVTVSSVAVSGGAFAISGATFPTTLNPGQSLALQVIFNPTVAGVVTGTATISSNSSTGSTSIVALTGVGIAAQLTMSATSLDFGDIALNMTSSKTLTLTSSGNSAVTVNSVTLSGAAFAISGATFPATLNPGQSLSLQVSFDPRTTGAATGTITIASSAISGGTSTVALTGTGIAAQLTVSASTLDFGSVNLNTTSTKTLTLTSSGNSAVTVNSVTLSGAAFAITGATFPATLNPGQTLSLQVSFDPTAAGPAIGTITISSSATSGGTSTVALTGSGSAAQLTLSASTLDFGSVNLNTTSTKTLTLTSSGNSAVTVNSVTLAGAAFAMTGATFPTALNPGQTLSLQVSFDPTSAGAATGTITISSNASTGGTATVSLTGTGTSQQLTVGASSLAFGNVVLNSTSTKTLTLTSSGTAAVTVNSATLAGTGFSMTGATFPTTLNPGQTLTLQVTFSPTTAGSASGTITVSSNSSTGGTATVSLSGTGTSQQLTVGASSLAFGNVVLNSTSTKTLTLTSSGTAAVTVNSATLAGTGFSMTGATFPTTLNPGQTLTLQVTFSPTTAGSASGTITVSSNSSTGGTATVSLTGTGTSQQLTVGASSLAFGNVVLNSTSTKTLTLTSSGTAAVTVNSATLAGTGFSMTGATFPTTLNPGQTLTLQVTFSPTTAGSASGTITISSNSSIGGTATVSLSGTGTSPQLSISTNTLAFGNVTLSSTSTKTLTLTSSGTAAVTVNSATLTGTAFSMTGATFPTTLNPGQTLTLQVTFSPTAAGSASGSITISSNSSTGGTATIPLSGTGTTNPVLTLSTTTLSFGNDPIGTPMTLSVTLSSTGTSPVTVSAAALTGAGFTFSGATFPVTLNPTIAITVQVQFKPTTSGSASGTLTFTSDSTTGSTSVVGLTGIGTLVQHQVSLSWAAPVNSPALVTGYNIYRATGGSSSFQLVNSSSTTAYVDLQVLSGTAYNYYVTSTDSVGTESVPSNQVAVTIP